MRRNKRVLLGVTLALALVAVSVAGTIAYMTSTDSEDNVFTAGGVKIDLIEQQRNAEGTALEAFQDNKVLMPIVGSAQGGLDELGQPKAEVAKNYVDKIVTIKNTGKSAAYIRAYFAIPSALDDGYETFNAGMNTLHFNFGNYKDDNGEWHTTYQNQWNWKNASGKWKYFETTIGEGDNAVAYNVYFADYYQTLAAGATTEVLVNGVYLDANVDTDEQGNYIDPRHAGADLSILKGDVHCPVYAVAVQAEGFDSVDAAVTAAFGAKFNPWGGNATNWQE